MSRGIQHTKRTRNLLLCPLRCVKSGGERSSEVTRVERRLLAEHERECCPQREQRCEVCGRGVRACEMSVHLGKCPLQIVKCPYWDYGCVEEMERRQLQLYERVAMYIHLKLSVNAMKELNVLDEIEKLKRKVSVLEVETLNRKLEYSFLGEELNELNDTVNLLEEDPEFSGGP